MSPQPSSSLSHKLNSSVHKLARKMKKPKEEIMPGELDSTEVQLARFFGKPAATFSPTTSSSTASVTSTPTTSSTSTATFKASTSSSSSSSSLSPTPSLVSSYSREDVSGRSASPSAASDRNQSAQIRHRNALAKGMERTMML